MAFIVAEVGSNWHCLADCLSSIDSAKASGADAVKFQLFSHKELYGYHGPNSLYAMEPGWVPILAKKAEDCGIEFMCTAFSPEGLRFIDPYVKRHKIASSELSYPELLIDVRKYEKPVILSTGGASFGEISQALKILEYSRVSLLHCVSAYPATNVNLFRLEALRGLGKDVGYSCHTDDYMTCVYAAKLFGATIIEKHFRLDGIKDTLDFSHSITPKDFKTMVRLISHDAQSYIEPQVDAATMYRRRLVATKDIKAHDKLIYGDNFGVYRVKEPDFDGISGFAANRVDGLSASIPLSQGQPIGPRAINF